MARYSPAKQLKRAHTIMGSVEAAAPKSEAPTIGAGPSEVEWPVGRLWSLWLLQAGLPTSYLWNISLQTTAAALAAGALGLLTSALWPLALIPLVPLAHWYRLNTLAAGRALAFERDYTAFLLALASSVRAGLDPLTAMIKSADLFPKASEVRRAILKLKTELDSGCAEEAAFGRFAEDIRHPDIGLFSTAMVLARREGSSLGGCLERLAKVTRHRQSFRRKARSAVAMQRLSALGLAGIAVLIVGMQFIGNPDSLHSALSTEFGRRALLIGALAIGGGIIWMLRLARTKV